MTLIASQESLTEKTDTRGGPAAKTTLPTHGTWVLSPVWELDPTGRS